jgi:hypothetical protein
VEIKTLLKRFGDTLLYSNYKYWFVNFVYFQQEYLLICLDPSDKLIPIICKRQDPCILPTECIHMFLGFPQRKLAISLHRINQVIFKIDTNSVLNVVGIRGINTFMDIR